MSPSVESSEDNAYQWVLNRGAACINCRRKKHVSGNLLLRHFSQLTIMANRTQKCDAQKPTCGRCLRARTNAPCVYDEPPRSRTQLLEDKLSELDAQISALITDSPPAASSNVNRSSNGQPGAGPVCYVSGPGVSRASLPTGAFHLSPFRATRTTLPPNPSLYGRWWESDEPPVPMKLYL